MAAQPDCGGGDIRSGDHRGRYSGKIIKASVLRLEIRYSNLLGAIVRGAIYIFAILAILLQLGVAESIINTMIMGFVGMFSLAFGLAFGLGGKNAAEEAIKTVSEKLKDK